MAYKDYDKIKYADFKIIEELFKYSKLFEHIEFSKIFVAIYSYFLGVPMKVIKNKYGRLDEVSCYFANWINSIMGCSE